MKFPVVKDLPQPPFHVPKRRSAIFNLTLVLSLYLPSLLIIAPRLHNKPGSVSSLSGLLMGHDPTDPPAAFYSSDDDEPGLCDDWDHDIPGMSSALPFPTASLSPKGYPLGFIPLLCIGLPLKSHLH